MYFLLNQLDKNSKLSQLNLICICTQQYRVAERHNSPAMGHGSGERERERETATDSTFIHCVAFCSGSGLHIGCGVIN